jgi:hypothetical protein
MKTLFKLGKDHPEYYPQSFLEERFSNGCISSGKGYVRIAHGFYSVRLTFVEWLERYKLKIL